MQSTGQTSMHESSLMQLPMITYAMGDEGIASGAPLSRLRGRTWGRVPAGSPGRGGGLQRGGNGRRGMRGARRVALGAGLVAAAAGLTACGSSSSSSSSASSDPVGAALSSAGVRVVLIPQQKNALTIVVPPCSEAQTVQSGTTKLPPGSNEVIIPKGAWPQALPGQRRHRGGYRAHPDAGGSRGRPPPPPGTPCRRHPLGP